MMSERTEGPERIPLSAEDLAVIRSACAAPPEPGPAPRSGTGSGSGPFRTKPQDLGGRSGQGLTRLQAVGDPPV